MTILITHPFVSLKGDGGDATLVRPSNWNAAHATSISTGKIVGRLSAGVGAFEEIALSAYMADLLSSTDAAALAGKLGLFETGDVKYTFKATASAGWVLIQGGTGTPGNTIGNAASGAVSRANADCLALFTLVYNSCSDAIAPVSGGRTGNPTNDFNANKTIRIPNLVGRSPIGAGGATNDGTTNKILGTLYGAETATLLTANLPPYTPQGNNGSVIVNTSNPVASGPTGTSTGGGGFGFNYPSTYGIMQSSGVGPVFTGVAQGGTSTPINITHASVALNAMVKL